MGKNIFNAFYKEYLTRAEKALGEMGRNSDGELVFSLRETLAGIRKSLGKIGIRTLLVEFQGSARGKRGGRRLAGLHHPCREQHR